MFSLTRGEARYILPGLEGGFIKKLQIGEWGTILDDGKERYS